MPVRVAIVGASGYTGVELLRVLRAHPGVELTALCAADSAGRPIAASWPGLHGLEDRTLEPVDPESLAARADWVFLGLPHGVSSRLAPQLLDRGLGVVDLGADFRLKDPAVYAAAYGHPHPCPERLPQAVYGLCEQQREALPGARLIAVPGCYPTATALAALPFVEAGLADWVVADCVSGVSGAGRKAGTRNLYCEVQESVVAYGLAGTHRHQPEIEQILNVPVTFTPHLAPMVRGMTATVHLRPRRGVTEAELRGLLRDRYATHPLVVVREDGPPASGEVRGSARAMVHVAWDAARGVLTAASAIDNLGKGASTQAVQAFNLALGLPEAQGLPLYPLLP